MKRLVSHSFFTAVRRLVRTVVLIPIILIAIGLFLPSCLPTVPTINGASNISRGTFDPYVTGGLNLSLYDMWEDMGVGNRNTIESFVYREDKKFYTMHTRNIIIKYSIITQHIGNPIVNSGEMEVDIVFTGYSDRQLEFLQTTIIETPQFGRVFPMGPYTRTENAIPCG